MALRGVVSTRVALASHLGLPVEVILVGRGGLDLAVAQQENRISLQPFGGVISEDLDIVLTPFVSGALGRAIKLTGYLVPVFPSARQEKDGFILFVVPKNFLLHMPVVGGQHLHRCLVVHDARVGRKASLVGSASGTNDDLFRSVDDPLMGSVVVPKRHSSRGGGRELLVKVGEKVR